MSVKKRVFTLALPALSLLVFTGCDTLQNSSSLDRESFEALIQELTATLTDRRFLAAKSVLVKNCLSCHSQFNFANEEEAMKLGYVVAKSPDQSRLFKALQGSGVSGGSQNMPLGQAALSSQDLEKIRDWINHISIDTPVEINRNVSFSCETDADPVATPVRRLSNLQYQNTIRDLVGLRFTAGSTHANAILASLTTAFSLIPDDSDRDMRRLDQYTTIDEALGQSHMDSYFNVAKILATEATTTARLQTLVGTCVTPAQNTVTNTCLNNFINSFGLQVLRRPVDATHELPIFRQAYSMETSGNNIARFRNVVHTMLMSPQFLLRIEDQGTPISGRSDLFTVSGYELASRLSYTVWQSMPDAALLTAAGSGDLVANYSTHLTRVFNDAKAATALRGFYSEWLRLEDLADLRIRLGNAQYDAFVGAQTPSTNLRADMINEVLDLMNYYTTTTAGTLTDVFTSRRSFARTNELATLYGVSTWNGSPGTMPQFSASAPRAGVLTRAALTATGLVATRPIHTAVRIKRKMICDEIEDPPANASGTNAPTLHPTATTREKTAALTQEPGTACASCHNSMNPFGFALENYDGLGRYRQSETIFYPSTANPTAVSIDASAQVEIFKNDPVPVNGGVELSDAIGSNPKTQACFVRNYYAFATGRKEDVSEDGCRLENLRSIAAAGGSLKDIYRGLASDQAFRLKKIEN